MGGVITKAYEMPRADMGEILRYAGVPSSSEGFSKITQECISEALPLIVGKVCYSEIGISREADELSLGFTNVKSAALMKNLTGCDRIILFGATVGVGIDRLIAKYGVLSPSKALMLQALGAERIEALCDEFCRDMESVYGKLRPRFSPGYGDLPLTIQREIFAYLGCPKRIGLTLNESLLMSPSKSVTAIIGIVNEE